MKKKIIYTDAPPEISEAIGRGSVVADFLPSSEMLMRKGKLRRKPAFDANFKAVSV